MRCTLPHFFAVGLLLCSACARKNSDDAASQAPAATAYSANGWSAAERAEYYHLAEGSELMPYVLMANLTSVKTGLPFFTGMERFGFLPDETSAANPHGLPVGLTVAKSRDSRDGGMEMVGFSCAACHVGELTYNGKKLRIDGAPSLIDLQGYQIEFKDSLDATLKNPRKLLDLVIALDRQQQMPDTPAGDAVSPYASDPALQTAGDVKEKPIADLSFHSVPTKMADAAALPAQPKNFSARLKTDVAFLKARLAYVKNGKYIVDGTEPGPGRVDAFGAARNFLFTKYAMKMQSPVSFPYIWNVPDTTQQRTKGQEVWIHYDGNTNSILERNIGQALGMGAVFDPSTFESTLRIENLHRLEILTHKLQPPQWPADLFGAVDESKAKTGEQIFQDKCANCHQDKLVKLVDVATDPNRANSFGQTVGTLPFPIAIAPILSSLKKRAFQDDGISAADQKGMDADPVVWRATGQYMARPLKGIWATAPYLHNGSVPTLYHLLHPEQRPAKFTMGNREYDPEKIGYQSASSAGGFNIWSYDTSQPGNSNIGHAGDQFGTNLPEDQKAALLEYLKKI